MALWNWPDLALMIVSCACSLVALVLYLYFRGCDASGMRLTGNAVVLCAVANILLLATNSL